LKKRSGKTARATPRAAVRHTQVRTAQSRGHVVFLVGFMGAGKSSVGRALAGRLNWRFEDLDDRIERHQGRRVAEIFRDSGDSEFRQAERSALAAVLGELRAGTARIVALGGGAFVDKQNAGLLKEAGVPVVFLDAPVEELWERCCAQAAEEKTERPLLRSREQFAKLYDERREKYRKATLRVRTGSRTVDAIAAEIEQALGLRKIRTRNEEGEFE